MQYYGQEETEPFAKASVLLDGPGGMLSLQDILEIPPDDVRVGMRVEAVWAPESERSTDGDRQPVVGERRRAASSVGVRPASPTSRPRRSWTRCTDWLR